MDRILRKPRTCKLFTLSELWWALQDSNLRLPPCEGRSAVLLGAVNPTGKAYEGALVFFSSSVCFFAALVSSSLSDGISCVVFVADAVVFTGWMRYYPPHHSRTGCAWERVTLLCADHRCVDDCSVHYPPRSTMTHFLHSNYRLWLLSRGLTDSRVGSSEGARP